MLVEEEVAAVELVALLLLGRTGQLVDYRPVALEGKATLELVVQVELPT